MFGFFTKKADKREVEQLKNAVQTGLNSAKQDITKLGVWVKHLNTMDSILKYDIFELNEELSRVKEELDQIKNMLSFVSNKPVFKHQQTVFNKQTAYKGVLNSVQTGVQTAFLDNLSVTERAIVFVLLNSDMKLSYEDIAAMLGKDRATIRGQINAIKQKSGGLIEEMIGENNKKRVYIPEKVKEVLLKAKKARGFKKLKENQE